MPSKPPQPVQPALSDLAGTSGPSARGADNLSGHWAVKISLPMKWHNLLIFAVTGHLEIVGRVERTKLQEGQYLDQFYLCGLHFPTFETPGARRRHLGRHGIIFPENLFDEGFFPASMPYRVQADAPGTYSFTSETVALLAGTELEDPPSSPWPSQSETRGVDADLDGMPGFTILPDTRPGLTPIGVGPVGANVAAKIWAAMRIRFNFQTHVLGADHLEGTAQTVGNLLDAAILGGEKMGRDGRPSGPLTASESQFLQNAFKPEFDRGRPSRVVMRRVSETPSCRDVRGMTW